MFPLIPLLGWTGLIGGAGSLLWYAKLSREDKAKADRIAEDCASDIFDKARRQLARAEENRVRALTNRHFEN